LHALPTYRVASGSGQSPTQAAERKTAGILLTLLRAARLHTLPLQLSRLAIKTFGSPISRQSPLRAYGKLLLVKAKLRLSLGLDTLPAGGPEPFQVFVASRQSPCPFLVKRLDESRATSLPRHYPTSSVLLAPPTSLLLGSDFGCPYTEPLRPSPAASEISRVTQQSFPLMPSRRPRKSTCSVRFAQTDGCGLPHLTTRVGTLNDKLRGSMGSLVLRPESLRSFLCESFLDPLGY
jgi:hypothetical protein